ncbi:MAG: RnfABCDGE type electron transport complex subunit G [Cyclobacteriaceae bacterium]
MAKKESTFLNMTTTLVVVTLLASTALGYVYELTKEPIAAAQMAKKVKAISQVVPEYDNNPVEEMYLELLPGTSDSLEMYPARKDGQVVATAIKSYSSKGYGGKVWLMVGLTADGHIYDIAVLEHKETPGLGTKMADASYIDQYRLKNPAETNLKVKKDGGEIDALTGATITSRAFSEAAIQAYNTYMKGGTHD